MISPTRNVAILLLAATLAPSPSRAQDTAKGTTHKTVAELLASNDRRLIRELSAYATTNPKAPDVEQAYMAMFEKVIEHDWFLEHEKLARAYLAANPTGPSARSRRSWRRWPAPRTASTTRPWSVSRTS